MGPNLRPPAATFNAPSRNRRDGSLARRRRLAGAGRELLRARRLLRERRPRRTGKQGRWPARVPRRSGSQGRSIRTPSGKILEGKVPDGPQLGPRGPDGETQHRPGRDVTLSAPKSVSLLAMVGGDGRIVEAHDEPVGKTLAWIEQHAVQTRVQDKATGAMVRVGGQLLRQGLLDPTNTGAGGWPTPPIARSRMRRSWSGTGSSAISTAAAGLADHSRHTFAAAMPGARATGLRLNTCSRYRNKPWD